MMNEPKRLPCSVLAYTASVNLILTKTGLPALFEPLYYETIDLWGARMRFRGVEVRFEILETGLLAARTYVTAGAVYDTEGVAKLAKSLMELHNLDGDAFLLVSEGFITCGSANPGVTACIAAAVMLGTTHFNTIYGALANE